MQISYKPLDRKKLVFLEEEHRYYYQGVPMISVSDLLSPYNIKNILEKKSKQFYGTAEMQRGTAVHKFLENIFKDNVYTDEDYWGLYYPNLEHAEACKNVARTVLSQFKGLDLREYTISLERKYTLECTIEHKKIILGGTIDFTAVKDDNVLLADYKTGSLVNFQKNRIKYIQQIQIYAFLYLLHLNKEPANNKYIQTTNHVIGECGEVYKTQGDYTKYKTLLDALIYKVYEKYFKNSLTIA